MRPKIEELDGYERVSLEEYDEDDGLAVAKLEFEDAVGTKNVYFKFANHRKVAQ